MPFPHTRQGVHPLLVRFSSGPRVLTSFHTQALASRFRTFNTSLPSIHGIRHTNYYLHEPYDSRRLVTCSGGTRKHPSSTNGYRFV